MSLKTVINSCLDKWQQIITSADCLFVSHENVFIVCTYLKLLLNFHCVNASRGSAGEHDAASRLLLHFSWITHPTRCGPLLANDPNYP